MTLADFFKQNTRCALGFSGGIDSAYLLYAAYELDVDLKPYFVKSAFQTDDEYIEAFDFAKRFGFELTVIEADVMSSSEIVANDMQRCYFCKKLLFSAIKERAEADGYDVVLEGTNYSDDISDRPGYRAICELGVVSPLRECKITKEFIRKELKAAGIDMWNKPSSACLATRIPTGTAITEDDLERVEAAEKFLKNLGFSDFRVRIMGDAAKIQLVDEQFYDAYNKRKEIYGGLSPHFKEVLLDLKER